ncbi:MULTISPECIES: alkylhydroperoxidase domain protein [unclassified Corynebacterium]|uniref:alkylhydroperoxidase domain protein n=1 Tax=unclassified Corynebacterium TaxID=2624378 RepID=UPI00264956F8|nr:alkylhydroperoxidase domain protein [Corynebacterium sp.]MDN5582266.1 alkylhydroperoxidase domain protein [Corynebacterium sp.]MDN5719594.1 alkylhydroperoxidase domain protein [Corynebacterium sp.]MDN6258949.1 alkylhydroperoxidase domain protein [Corynebacterium sp.]MDN6324006.1 alkylhydroperoxidase domain protein [Corynebacterium sp.]MDN6509713.1 alkylhydroperoxidase domain protein [Corynebacterium sp.]
MSDSTDSADIIELLAGINPGEPVAELRRNRSQARTNAQHSFRVLLEAGDGEDDGSGFTDTERYVVAAFVAGLHQGQAADFYADLLGDVVEDAVATAVAESVQAGLTVGPYGTYREPDLAGESVPGPEFSVDPHVRGVLGEKLTAALEFAHLLVFHPRDSRPERLAPLAWSGWTPTQVVSLAQLISFLCFQIRAAAGLFALKAADAMYMPLAAGPVRRRGKAQERAQEPGGPAPLTGGAFDVLTYPDLHRPTRFVSHSLGWQPWVPPVEEDELTERQRTALVDPMRAKSSYFRLLARDPDALEARTLTDKDIFYNVTDGAGRAEREISAAVTSRYNGCVYCASVHTGRALQESTGREDDVQRLCDEAVGPDSLPDLGSEAWNAIAEASVALTSTPVDFCRDHVERLRAAGLDDASIVDVINGAAFFNWANRLMLSLGEPELPARFR